MTVSELHQELAGRKPNGQHVQWELINIFRYTDGPGQLAVAIEAAPINPSDLTLIKGVYGVRPELPAALGAEGVGRVIAVGDGVETARVGERVLVVPTLEQATWRQETVLDERNAVLVDADGDPLQLAMIGINPLTAYSIGRFDLDELDDVRA